MNAVRYFSKSGNTKKIAEAIAEGAGVKAVSITEEPVLSDPVDILFLGGAPYANIMAPELRKYAEDLKAEQVKKVVLFTTSNWSRRTVKALKKILEQKGIPVAQDHFYAQMLTVNSRIGAARAFGKANCIESGEPAADPADVVGRAKCKESSESATDPVDGADSSAFPKTGDANIESPKTCECSCERTKTGDANHILPWLILLGMTLGALLTAVLVRRRKKDK